MGGGVRASIHMNIFSVLCVCVCLGCIVIESMNDWMVTVIFDI